MYRGKVQRLMEITAARCALTAESQRYPRFVAILESKSGPGGNRVEIRQHANCRENPFGQIAQIVGLSAAVRRAGHFPVMLGGYLLYVHPPRQHGDHVP